jgi:L-ascorbate metabolism protein UlaG (beta-lactamase superfamily)
MHLTWLDSNSWLIELANQRILLDPWLVGDLSFGSNANWFFRSFRTADRAIPENIDLILLSQGLPDHAHPQTLQILDKSIPVVGSVNAAKIATELGFKTVTALKPGELHTIAHQLKIQATNGSPVGPTTIENGYLLKDLSDGHSAGTTLYYEPHGYYAVELLSQGPIDVVITPMIDLSIQPGIPVIKGIKSALALAQALRPQVMVPTAAGGKIEFSGLLLKLLKATGSPDDLAAQLMAVGLTTKVLQPTPGDRLQIPLNAVPIAA